MMLFYDIQVHKSREYLYRHIWRRVTPLYPVLITCVIFKVSYRFAITRNQSIIALDQENLYYESRLSVRYYVDCNLFKISVQYLYCAAMAARYSTPGLITCIQGQLSICYHTQSANNSSPRETPLGTLFTHRRQLIVSCTQKWVV